MPCFFLCCQDQVLLPAAKAQSLCIWTHGDHEPSSSRCNARHNVICVLVHSALCILTANPFRVSLLEFH